MRSLTLARATGAGLLLAVIALVVLYLIPSSKNYVFLPDRAHALEPLVRISGEHGAPSGGGVYFVDVRFRKARLLEDLLGRLHALITSHRPGDRLRITYSRSGRVVTATIRTITSPDNKREAAIGILVVETGGSPGKLPIKVRIDTRGVGGPSAGLAFALDLTEELGRDVDRGYKVAATGELELDGSVLPIGAVKQKTIGAREAGVDV